MRNKKVQNLEKEESLQQNYVSISTSKKVGTKYGYIIFWFWKDTKIQNLQKNLKRNFTTKEYYIGRICATGAEINTAA